MLPTLRPGNPNFGSGPTAKRPGWSLAALEGALLGRSHRASAPKARLAEVIERSRALLGIPAELSHRHPAGLGYRCLRVRDVEPAGCPRHRRARLRELRRRLADRHREGAAPHRRAGDDRTLWRAARPERRRSGPRHGVLLERHHLGGPGSRRRLDQRRSRRPDLVRRHFGRVRHAAAVGQARCRDLVLAEGAGRRGAARHAGAVAARGRAAREPSPGLADAQAVPADQGRQADRGHLQGRDDQHALDAGGRGRARRPALGGSDRRAAGAGRALRAQPRRDRAPGSSGAAGPGSWPSARDPFADLGLPRASSTMPSPRWTTAGSRRSSRTCAGCSPSTGSPTTSRATATRPRACGSGAAPRSRPPMSAALLPWLDWAYAETRARLG